MDRQKARQLPRQVWMFYIPSVLLVGYTPVYMALNFSLHKVAFQANRQLLPGSLLERKHVFFLFCTSLSPSAAALCNKSVQSPPRLMPPQMGQWGV